MEARFGAPTYREKAEHTELASEYLPTLALQLQDASKTVRSLGRPSLSGGVWHEIECSAEPNARKLARYYRHSVLCV